jgi:hypothetical protein
MSNLNKFELKSNLYSIYLSPILMAYISFLGFYSLFEFQTIVRSFTTTNNKLKSQIVK